MRARFGALTGYFLVGYAIARIIGEFFRQPDAFLGFLFAGATMGQLLSLPMLIAGLVLIVRAAPPGLRAAPRIGVRLSVERLDAFMARANAAYYASRDPFADFTTAPEITQVFGELLGLWAAVAWQAWGHPIRCCWSKPGRAAAR